MKFLLKFYIFLFFPGILAQTIEPPNNDYFSIGAHLNADAFGKQLRKFVSNRLQLEEFKDLIANEQWITSSFGLKELQNLSRIVDSRFKSALESLPKLIKPISSSFVSCHSIHDLVRLPPTEPCAIRVSDNGNPPKYELKSSDDPLLVRQFLLSADIQFEFPAEFLPPRIHAGPILSTILSHRKTVFIVADTGSLSTHDQLDTARHVIHQLLDIATNGDSFSVFSAVGTQVTQLGCNHGISQIDRKTLSETKSSVDDLQLQEQSVSTNHAKALETVVSKADDFKDSSEVVIIYISRGLLEGLEQAGTTMKRLSESVSKASIPIKINTLLLIEERRSVPMWSSQFMENIAKQEGENSIPGETVFVEKNALLDLDVIERLLRIPEIEEDTEKVKIFLPITHHRHITVSQSTFFNISRVVVGAEVSLWILMAEVLEHPHIRGTDAVVHLVTSEGLILLSSTGFEDVLLSSLDNWPHSSEWLLKDWARGDSGDFEVYRKSDNKTLFYLWAKLSSAPFALVIRSERPFPQKRSSIFPINKMTSSLRHLMWHETSLVGTKICSQFGTPVVEKTAALYLSSSLSSKPNENPANHWVYLTDKIGLIKASGLRPGIREQVALLNSLVEKWVTADGSGVVSKFAATPHGVMVVYPGTVVSKGFDPTKQQWFVEASQSPNNVIITGPSVTHHLGNVVTISIAVTTRESQIVAVLGMEITSSFLGKLLLESISTCTHTRQCLLFSSKGTVFYSDKVYPDSDVVERFHISHLEPLLTSDMTNNQRLVKKSLCEQGTSTRRQLVWNPRYTRVHTTPCGDFRRGGSVASEVLVVPGTQLFLAMVNTTCVRTPVTVFCPCSVNDGRCLFCGRFDSLECECPCTCPGCTKEKAPRCGPSHREDKIAAFSTTSETPVCTKPDCAALLYRDACVSVPGCEWCRYSPLLQPLTHARCTSTSVCYNGVLGRTSIHKSLSGPPPGWLSPAPLGPIAAGVIVMLFILFGFVYCFRNHLSRSAITRRSTAVDAAPLFGTTTDTECDPTVFKEERVPVQLAYFERDTPPRRPAPPSDHGYSTMTDRNEETTSAVSTSLTDQPSSITSTKPPNIRPLTSPLMTSLVTHAEVHVEPFQPAIC